MMSYYMGDRKTAASVLSRAAILGIDSKLFDFQALVLLAFSYFSDKDRKGIERCVADFGRILERHQDSPRIQRFASIAQTLLLIQQRQFSAAVAAVRDMAREIDEASFDFEAACNLASLLAVLAATSIDLSDGEKWVRSLGMRYANTRGLTELMANACNVYPAYSDMVRECLPQINQSAEKAMAQSLAGDAEGAVRKLLQLAESSLNSKLADMAQQVLLRHRERIADAEALQDSVQAVRTRCGNAPTRAVLGQDGERRPGGVVIRTRTPPPPEAAASAALAAIASRVELSADQILDMPDEPSIDEILGVPTPEPHDPAEKLRLRPM